ncbi:hypothetical protein GALMADRAFT_237563 [Galerina marginata CBS 339.88]|uniref:Uncharacterized protein n=1 Tax=Galerina marginata (strain CBS 339.88) TaxID=685588 RepID=A0A067TJ02_GALM3|nr:hypothetical protein GALMADRAFT_255994 [Galerina marginata CBS 339.88]KDR82322.1 hypothetical protein GALMADRAFT_237563 [Galerina marginata CBS 339.88]
MVVLFLAGFSAGFLLLYMDWLSDFYFGIGPAAPSKPYLVLPDQSATYNSSNCKLHKS